MTKLPGWMQNGLVLILLTGFIVLFIEHEKESVARQEAVHALYMNSWTAAAAEENEFYAAWTLKQMSDPLKRGFIDFVVHEVREELKDPDHTVKEFLNGIPSQKGIGVGVGGTQIHEAEDQSVAYGVRVFRVYENTPASRAGLCEGDRILSIDGERIVGQNEDATVRHVLHMIQKNDQTIVFRIARDAHVPSQQTKELTVRISEHNAFKDLADRPKIMMEWESASLEARVNLEMALSVGEDVSKGKVTNTPIGKALQDIVRARRDLTNAQEKFISDLELKVAPMCK